MRVGLGVAKWAAAVLVVSLVLPAATKQWSDNQQQRQLKTEVTTKLAGAVARATTDGGFLLADQLEAGQSQAFTRAAYQNTLVMWKSEASAIEAQLAGYFAKADDPNDDALVNAMRAYSRVVQAYLGYCQFYEGYGERRQFREDSWINLRKMRAQLDGAPRFGLVPLRVLKSVTEDWSPDDKLEGDDMEVPERTPRSKFKEAAQNVWAQNIVNASAPIINMINQRQPRGFQVGARAFIRQVLQPIG